MEFFRKSILQVLLSELVIFHWHFGALEREVTVLSKNPCIPPTPNTSPVASFDNDAGFVVVQ